MSVYIRLFHGRADPAQNLGDWGYTGPTLGPFVAIHFTYLTHVRCFPEGHRGDEMELVFAEECLAYDGSYYGDFEIVSDP